MMMMMDGGLPHQTHAPSMTFEGWNGGGRRQGCARVANVLTKASRCSAQVDKGKFSLVGLNERKVHERIDVGKLGTRAIEKQSTWKFQALKGIARGSCLVEF
jgi:hypothetical protein